MMSFPFFACRIWSCDFLTCPSLFLSVSCSMPVLVLSFPHLLFPCPLLTVPVLSFPKHICNFMTLLYGLYLCCNLLKWNTHLQLITWRLVSLKYLWTLYKKKYIKKRRVNSCWMATSVCKLVLRIRYGHLKLSVTAPNPRYLNVS